ncbi:hypothetical protein CDJ04_13955 [Salmonella enterica]|nr:hypothetical protein [Salmonella enterica]EBZ5138244.1 hypothetical protein [Salmonella enterica subsp. enterica serovar Antsalova]ECS6899735.1 hypothetical protein [Salmonella enterica]EHI8599368.1 hypothetical protein [Salmonella enterica subsp. enterica serovar 51:z:1,5]EHI8983520.1 hypothetical protein [Salmonella enterica subsp. enterica serovar 51:z:1,5]
MFNVKRNGASVEITDIPLSIPFGVFKDIADKTGANECLIAYVKDKDCYEVVIRHDSVNMAAAAAWMALEARNREVDYADVQASENGDEEISDWWIKRKLLVTIGNDEIKINGDQLHEVLGGFSGISRTTDVKANFKCKSSTRERSVTITIKPILTETTLEEVLIRIGMIVGGRMLEVIDDRTKSISS